MSTQDVYWRNHNGVLQEFLGADEAQVLPSGAIYLAAKGVKKLVVAPGDWHDLEITEAVA